MWCEAPESMIQEHGGVVIEADRADVDVPEWANDEVGAVGGCSIWETKRRKTGISSLYVPPLGKVGSVGIVEGNYAGVEVIECAVSLLLQTDHLLYTVKPTP